MPKRVKVLSKNGNFYYAKKSGLKPSTRARTAATLDRQRKISFGESKHSTTSCYRLNGDHREALKIMSKIDGVSYNQFIKELIEATYKDKVKNGLIPQKDSNLFLKSIVVSRMEQALDKLKKNGSISIENLQELETVAALSEELVS